MADEPKILIEQQDWLPIPSALQDGLSGAALSKRRLRAWSLVLQARQIPCRGEREGRGWQLLVPTERFSEACAELRSYEELNRNWPPQPPPERAQLENRVATLWVLIALGAFFLLTQHRIPLLNLPTVDWVQLGNADAGKIINGEWWRLITALTLHADGLHLAGNIVVGGLFVNRLCRDLGSGLGWSLVLASGILGNLLNAFLQSPDHRAIGASTAVFGAVGLLAAINLRRYRRVLYRRWMLPVAAALGLLALLGAGGENTDIGAHLFGFGFGIALGLVTGQLTQQGERPSWQVNALLATGSLLVLLGAWGWALL